MRRVLCGRAVVDIVSAPGERVPRRTHDGVVDGGWYWRTKLCAWGFGRPWYFLLPLLWVACLAGLIQRSLLRVAARGLAALQQEMEEVIERSQIDCTAANESSELCIWLV